MVSVQGASDPRYLGSTSGISFARVVFAAVKSSVSGNNSERGSVRGTKSVAAAPAAGGTSMRDSFFGLHTKPTIRQAPFPDEELGRKLVDLYFEHANPQIPILHRPEFMKMFMRVYVSDERTRTARESYMLNIVFAIGAGIIMGSSKAQSPSHDSFPPSNKKRRVSRSEQHQAEEYHASAIFHLESFLSSGPAADRPDGFGGGLEELQAVLLLAGFALLRPVAPGLWYIVGVAVRLGVDLGLHYEDGVDIDDTPSDDAPIDRMKGSSSSTPTKIDARERGRREWVRDLRRRLWWCVYSLDRLVSTCVGRPFGITDQVVTTEFPSLLDDNYITTGGFLEPLSGSEKPSYKFVSHHYFRLRLLQSEILQVLQHRQAQQARANGANEGNQFMHTKLPSPFLQNFSSFRQWRQDIDRRLWEWIQSAPNQLETGVQFSPLFLELNYWQAVITLYRQSLAVPAGLVGELRCANEDVSSPSMVNIEEQEDEEYIFLKVAEAGQKVLKLYRQLHRVHLVNYTFLATHHLFMAGISFLYAIWHSPVVRSHLSLDEVDFTVLAATSVLSDLIEKCPPAEACRDAFDRMSKATIQMCLSTTGFGPQALAHLVKLKPPSSGSPTVYTSDQVDSFGNGQDYSHTSQNQQWRQPRFDMNLKDLFVDDGIEVRSSGSVRGLRSMPPPLQAQLQQPSQQRAMSQTLKSEPSTYSNVDSLISPTLQQQYSTSTSTSLSPNLPQHAQPHASQISPFQITNQTPYTSFAQNIQSTYPDFGGFNDLDFLDSFPVNGANASNGDNPNALDLGFGMGFDGNHDWADGNGLDIFDGFFFGGTGNGGGL
ncbi:hypothetical protein W97_07829 [Coniosporium apollinis CBS 100218]|uniref:Xylanolytic transcriptional activator regulatory domain-containing protein n=1 Tax=Coniosporium apollinis (strain CBS 100218) TaxID=1168221 RepID=R7Z3T5_CONA1|nr:uncharacterized protein W97_07829 [Coniosporium apollinis CBS 100218]EON68571.1 hypothetical protein W97_07829 [Coniosporium apollinis CBS 100218]